MRPFPVNPMSVGPIVGHTTPTTVRLWGRGEDPRHGGGRCHGVAQILAAGSTTPAQARYFELRPEDDFTGSVDFSGLEPGRRYAYRIGYFFSDAELVALPPPTALALTGASTSSFRTQRPTGSPALSFVFGSCCKPGPSIVEAIAFPDGDRGDETFHSILQQLEGGTPTDLLLMIGDQIYADEDRDWTLGDYATRYRAAFSRPSMRRLMSSVPTYMILDDNDIANDWSMDKLGDPRLTEARRAANQARFQAAMAAYRAYQASHGPPASDGSARYWYSFEAGPARFFVMDLRTERYRDAAPPRIMSARQLEALEQWLLRDPGGLNFVVSTVPFFPDMKCLEFMRDDKWTPFKDQRQRLLDFMRDHGMRRTVFLCGDVHVSMWAELRSTSRPEFLTRSIISSAFHALVPPPDWTFQTSGPLEGHEDYVLTRHGGHTPVSNFTRLTWKEPVLQVEIFDRRGQRLHSSALEL